MTAIRSAEGLGALAAMPKSAILPRQLHHPDAVRVFRVFGNRVPAVRDAVVDHDHRMIVEGNDLGVRRRLIGPGDRVGRLLLVVMLLQIDRLPSLAGAVAIDPGEDPWP